MFNCRQDHDCLKSLEDDHVDPLIDQDVKNWYGQLYSLDEQCRIAMGPESFFGRVWLCYVLSRLQLFTNNRC